MKVPGRTRGEASRPRRSDAIGMGGVGRHRGYSDLIDGSGCGHLEKQNPSLAKELAVKERLTKEKEVIRKIYQDILPTAEARPRQAADEIENVIRRMEETNRKVEASERKIAAIQEERRRSAMNTLR